jgi:hypothetical protein
MWSEKMTENVVYVKKISVVVKEMEVTTPIDTDTAIQTLDEDTAIEEYTVDSMVIFETKDGRKEQWNEVNALIQALEQEARQ